TGHLTGVHKRSLVKAANKLVPRNLMNANVLRFFERWLGNLANVECQEAPELTGQARSTSQKRSEVMPALAYIPCFFKQLPPPSDLRIFADINMAGRDF